MVLIRRKIAERARGGVGDGGGLISSLFYVQWTAKVKSLTRTKHVLIIYIYIYFFIFFFHFFFKVIVLFFVPVACTHPVQDIHPHSHVVQQTDFEKDIYVSWSCVCVAV